MATRKYHRKTNTFRKTKKRQRGGNQKDKDLFDAIKIGNIDEVKNALKNGANVNAKNDAGDTPLIHAIKTDNIIDETKYDMVELLLDQPGIEVNAKNDAGHTPLICAITSNNIIYDTKYYMVELLLDHPDIIIELDVGKNKELRLAEGEEENDQDQGGIPYLIEDYILAKNDIKENRDNNIKQLSKYKRPNIPSLKTMAHHQLSTQDAILLHNAVNDNTVPPLDGKLGGKRKTRKIKSKKSKKSKRKSKRH